MLSLPYTGYAHAVLRRKHGEPPYNPDDFYLRVDNKLY